MDFLAKTALADSNDDDWLLFIDSDSFPVTPISRLIDSTNDFVAVQRLENLGDIQPHPCFCLVKVARFKELDPSWRPGTTWPDWFGTPRTDVGAGFLDALRRKDCDWDKLLRLRSKNLHPLFFAIYGSGRLGPVAYHHGAGSRAPETRVEISMRKRAPIRWRLKRLGQKFEILKSPSLWRLFGKKTGAVLVQQHREMADQQLRERLSKDLDFWHLLYRAKTARLSPIVKRQINKSRPQEIDR